MLGLRLGTDPRVVVTSTPRSTALVRELAAAPTTALTRGTTLDNERHLAPEYIKQIIVKYQGTRLGRQELEGEILDAPEGAWFSNFSESRHVQPVAFRPDLPIQIGLDIGVGRYCAAVVFQAEKLSEDQTRFLVIGEYLAEGLYTEQNAPAIKEVADQFAGGQVLSVWCDPAASARTGIGPSAMSEIVRIFSDRPVARSPQAPILDSLDMIEFILDHEDLLIHP